MLPTKVWLVRGLLSVNKKKGFKKDLTILFGIPQSTTITYLTYPLHIFILKCILTLFFQFRTWHIFIPFLVSMETQGDNKWPNFSSSFNLWQDFLKTPMNSCFVFVYISSKWFPFLPLVLS